MVTAIRTKPTSQLPMDFTVAPPLPAPVKNESAWRVWHGPHRVTATDIVTAIATFQEVTGESPRLMVLNPKNNALPIPQGLELWLIGGCLSTEVWLAASEPVPVSRGQFDSRRDRAVIEAGGFFCGACLIGKPASERSRNPRYCVTCYESLRQERAKADSPDFSEGGVIGTESPLLEPSSNDKGCDKAGDRENVTDDAVTARIIELSSLRKGKKAISSRAIADQLKSEGVIMSYRTVARVLAKRGKR